MSIKIKQTRKGLIWVGLFLVFSSQERKLKLGEVKPLALTSGKRWHWTLQTSSFQQLSWNRKGQEKAKLTELWSRGAKKPVQLLSPWQQAESRFSAGPRARGPRRQCCILHRGSQWSCVASRRKEKNLPWDTEHRLCQSNFTEVIWELRSSKVLYSFHLLWHKI